ncbi:MAG: MlaD family protein [Verrucomicrobiota bacterium]|nr:MlaD family protein [Verrucomicrobiota bacterium]
MKRNVSDYLVAFSVIACSIVLLAALTIALSGYRLKKSERTLQINYEDVTGIKVHSEVRYAGAPAGRVIGMRHLSAAERGKSGNTRDAVRVTISLDEGIPPLPADVTATLSSDTLLAPKFVALSAGTPGGKALPNNASIEGHPAYGIEQITAAAGPLFENANKLLDNLNGTVTSVKGDLGEFLPKLAPLVDTVKTDLADLQNVIQGLDGIEKTADTFFGSAGKFVGSTDKQIQDQMKELHVILLNLKVISTHAKALVDTLSEKPNRLIFSGKANRLTPEEEIIKSHKPLPAKQP